ncbi:MAG TPA: glycosyltransferase family A protein [Candidatus Paceibacterota bacterium]|nr:glycosyltransferase family A protein [Candidatus Paceibacterota bacterium]
MKKTYYHFFCVRDSEKSILDVVDSIINQSYKPEKIIVVNDGSSDQTGKILDEYKNKFPELIEVIHTDSKTRDYSRIPKLWNMCIRKEYDFHMVGAGDVVYEKDYAQKLLNEFEKNSKLMICSGDHIPFKTKFPHGGGRFVKQSFFFKNYDKYFEIMGYESEILYRALSQGYEIKVFNDIILEHREELGYGHNFEEFGRGMKALGYHPLYVLGRCFTELLKDDNIGKKGIFNMFWKYLTYKPAESGYFSSFPKEVRKEIYNYQKQHIIKLLKTNIFRMN